MYKTDVFISAEEIKEIVGISKSKAYSLIQELNAELKEKGYLTVTGRVSRKYFEERFYGLLEKNRRKWMAVYKDKNVEPGIPLSICGLDRETLSKTKRGF